MASDKTSSKTLFDTGSVIDEKWVLIERIGKGGMGEVYRAHQLNLKRDVAIKVLSGDILQDSDENPQEVANAIQRLEIEVQTMAQVRHPNVLQIYDYGSVDVRHNGAFKKVPYIAMEYVPGNTLRYTMSEQGFDDETELLAEWLKDYFLPVLDGLGAIHAHDIIHRDVKPENILMDGDTPKITEFLNEVIKSLTVVDGVVKHDEEIWLYLGDGSAPSDQIIYRHSRFHLRQADWAPEPVTRVTWLGALAYARHYGKRLPTYAEWRAVEERLLVKPDPPQPPAANDMMHGHMQTEEASASEAPIAPGRTVTKEWISAEKPASSSERLIVEWFADDSGEKTTKRYPWEGFYDVGFRTVRDVSGGRSPS